MGVAQKSIQKRNGKNDIIKVIHKKLKFLPPNPKQLKTTQFSTQDLDIHQLIRK